MLTPEELLRIKGYTLLIEAAHGSLELLTFENRLDLSQLLREWLAQIEEQPGA
jgi:hypothetical protein